VVVVVVWVVVWVVVRWVVVVVGMVAALREGVAVLQRGRDLDGFLRGRGVPRRRAAVELLIPPALHVAQHERDALPAHLRRHRGGLGDA
jgi:hypothetical protein